MDICKTGEDMGSTHNRQICRTLQQPVKKVQFSQVGSTDRGDRCISTGLDRRDELLLSPLLVNSKNIKEDPEPTRGGNINSAGMDRTEMVPDTIKSDGCTTHLYPELKTVISEDRKGSGTMQKQKMENSCLETVWEECLTEKGWNKNSINCFFANWAKSTLHSYSKIIDEFHSYCRESDSKFIGFEVSTLANYLCEVASRMSRPKSALNLVMAAITSFCEATQHTEILSSGDLQKLVTGLIKGGTSMPMKRSKVMPVDPFMNLFTEWKGNWGLELEQLRLKCVTLLAFALMLRPSDIAPNAVLVADGNEQKMCLTVNQLEFQEDGSCKVTFHGIKNDYSRDGFEVVLQPASNPRLDLVLTLKNYLHRTQYVRNPGGAVFLSLKKPYSALSSKTIARILERAIFLQNQRFLGKEFLTHGRI